MNKLTDRELRDETNALAAYFRNRELRPEQITALCAAAVGEILGRNRTAKVIDDEAAERMLQVTFSQMRLVTFAGQDRRN